MKPLTTVGPFTSTLILSRVPSLAPESEIKVCDPEPDLKRLYVSRPSPPSSSTVEKLIPFKVITSLESSPETRNLPVMAELVFT